MASSFLEEETEAKKIVNCLKLEGTGRVIIPPSSLPFPVGKMTILFYSQRIFFSFTEETFLSDCIVLTQILILHHTLVTPYL